MKPASLKDIKYELSTLTPKELVQLLTTIVKYRKENKELVSYLLFDSKDPLSFVSQMKLEMEELLSPVNRFNVNTSLKYIRTVLRNTKKVIRFTGSREIEAELLLHFCSLLKKKNLPLTKSKGINKIWERTLINIAKAISVLHEDLKYDYQTELDGLLQDI